MIFLYRTDEWINEGANCEMTHQLFEEIQIRL